MKKLIGGGLLALAIGLAAAPVAGDAPRDWLMMASLPMSGTWTPRRLRWRQSTRDSLRASEASWAAPAVAIASGPHGSVYIRWRLMEKLIGGGLAALAVGSARACRSSCGSWSTGQSSRRRSHLDADQHGSIA